VKKMLKREQLGVWKQTETTKNFYHIAKKKSSWP
jgi:hypothetical protein